MMSTPSRNHLRPRTERAAAPHPTRATATSAATSAEARRSSSGRGGNRHKRHADEKAHELAATPMRWRGESAQTYRRRPHARHPSPKDGPRQLLGREGRALHRNARPLSADAARQAAQGRLEAVPTHEGGFAEELARGPVERHAPGVEADHAVRDGGERVGVVARHHHRGALLRRRPHRREARSAGHAGRAPRWARPGEGGAVSGQGPRPRQRGAAARPRGRRASGNPDRPGRRP